MLQQQKCLVQTKKKSSLQLDFCKVCNKLDVEKLKLQVQNPDREGDLSFRTKKGIIFLEQNILTPAIVQPNK